MPAGDTTQCFGGIEVIGLHERDELIALLDADTDPVELVAVLSRRFAPPQLQNTEGDPLVLCAATLKVPDPAALTSLLDTMYERHDDELDDTGPQPPQWFDHVTTHGMQRIRATLRLEGDELHLDTNSEARLDRVLVTLRTLQPWLTVIDEARRPAHEIGEAMHRAGMPSPTGEPPTNELVTPTTLRSPRSSVRWPATTSRPGSTTPSPHWPGTRRVRPPPTPPAVPT